MGSFKDFFRFDKLTEKEIKNTKKDIKRQIILWIKL